MAEHKRHGGIGELARGLGRAFGGAVLFAFPLLMTMEMWQLGMTMSRLKLALFVAVCLPLLFGLSTYSGFQRTASRTQDLCDAFIAFGVGFIASAFLLFLFGAIGPGMALEEVVGRIAVQTVPASIGAIVARRQLHPHEGDDDEAVEKRASYAGELFLMAAGAVFVAFNVAPTEDVLVIAFTMTPWHALALALASIAMLHAFVYTVGFPGQEERPEDAGFWLTFLHFTVAGYGIALLVALYVLWTFERIVGVGIVEAAMMTVVMAFPAALGAATARLIV